jgi:flavin-dependent dehydrogenase
MTPEDYFLRTVTDSSKLRELFAGATPTMPYRVTSDYSYFRRDLAAERMLLVGDAAGFFDPIFSSGVYMSMWSARLAVGLLGQAEAAARGLTVGERRRYSLAIKRHAGVFQRLIDAFYDNDSFAVFMSPGAPYKIRSAICSIVAGHARLTWPLWWRFRAFLLVCWLQRRQIRVCQALDYAAPSQKIA